MGNDDVLLVKIVCLKHASSRAIQRNFVNTSDALRGHLIDLLEEFLFDLEILNDRFDHQVAGFDSIVQVCRRLDSAVNIGEILLSGLLIFVELLLHHAFQTRLNDVETLIEKLLFLIHENDVMIGLCRDLRLELVTNTDSIHAD